MAPDLSAEQIAAVAALANLELDSAEVDLFARQLAAILAYADELRQADTAGVPPTAAVTRQTAERPDYARPSLAIDDVLANAPDASRAPGADGGFFRVPRIIG